MLKGDESHEPTRREVGHDRWLAMQSAYAEYRGACEALECTRPSANESSINERSLLTIAVDRQRVAFEGYFEARMEFLEFRFDEGNRPDAGRVAPATRDTDHSSISSAVRRWLAMSFQVIRALGDSFQAIRTEPKQLRPSHKRFGQKNGQVVAEPIIGGGTRAMHWNIDKRTWEAATKYPFQIRATTPVGPFSGRAFNTASWNHRVIQPANWPGSILRSDPDQIIQQFREHRYTQALALVVSWGTMWRRPEAVWGGRKLETIESVLRDCEHSIRKSESIALSWEILRAQLSWTPMLISKTLHFLCLSLGFDNDPPVPIDGAVIRQRVWPRFRNSIPASERPWDWEGDTFEAYSRYMTAIHAWANLWHWSTPEVERTICVEVQPE